MCSEVWVVRSGPDGEVWGLSGREIDEGDGGKEVEMRLNWAWGLIRILMELIGKK